MTEPVASPPRRRSVLIATVAVGVVMAALLVVLVTSGPAGDRPSKSPVLGSSAPALGGAPLQGSAFDIGANDRWLVVNFFATWCVPCVQEHPELRRFAEETAETGQARVVSVVYGDKAEAVAEFFEDNGGDWTVLDSDNGRTALDWGVAKVPESFLVSPTGIVVERFQGGVVASQMLQVIDEIEGSS